MDKPLVSIILPTYNSEEYIRKSLDSIINQTHPNWELIIVNDCSTDSTPGIIQEYVKKDSRIRIVNNEINKKLPASLNIGFSQAKGTYYTWTSDDNYYYPNAIEKMVDFLERNQDFGMVYAVCDLLDDSGKVVNIIGERPATVKNILDGDVCGACFLYRASVAKDVGEYNTNLYLAEDYEYWLRVKLKYNIANLREHLYAYRQHKNNLTSSNRYQSQLLGIKAAVDLMEEFLTVFPQSKAYIENEMAIRKALIYNDAELLNVLLKEKSKKILYKNLKRFYGLTKDKLYLNYIKRLGGMYFFKGLNLDLKTKKPKFYEISIRRYGDDRGWLTTIENSEVPFKIKRVYYLSDVPKDKERAHHAHKYSQRVLSAIQGSVDVALFDGKDKKVFTLDSPNKAVYVDKKVWCELSNFNDAAIVLALSSDKYDEEDYIKSFDDYLKYIKN